jgi:uncharacterized membrane-anchored protein YitT (DUF2179 family)
MNPFWTKVIVDTAMKRNAKHKNAKTQYAKARAIYEFRVSAYRALKDMILIVAGVLSAAFGLKGFLLPNNFIDGGATGISLLIAEVSPLPVPVLLIIVNAPFILLGYRYMGFQFVIKTIIAIVGLALCVALLPSPVITSDKLLISVFGGVFLGLGIGLAVRGGAVLDGTEIVAVAFSRNRSLSVGDVIMALNIMIFAVSAYLLSIEIALYAILTYISASKTVDFVIEGIEEYTGVTIVSIKPNAIKQMIVEVMGRGVTVYSGDEGYGSHGPKAQGKIIFTVITRLETGKLNAEIMKIDPGAFIVSHSVNDIKGGIVKKRPLH